MLVKLNSVHHSYFLLNLESSLSECLHSKAWISIEVVSFLSDETDGLLSPFERLVLFKEHIPVGSHNS